MQHQLALDLALFLAGSGLQFDEERFKVVDFDLLQVPKLHALRQHCAMAALDAFLREYITVVGDSISKRPLGGSPDAPVLERVAAILAKLPADDAVVLERAPPAPPGLPLKIVAELKKASLRAAESRSRGNPPKTDDAQQSR